MRLHRPAHRLTAFVVLLAFVFTPLATASPADTLRTEQGRATAGLTTELTATPKTDNTGLEETAAKVQARIADQTFAVALAAATFEIERRSAYGVLSDLTSGQHVLAGLVARTLALDEVQQQYRNDAPLSAEQTAVLDTFRRYAPIPSGADVVGISTALQEFLRDPREHPSNVATDLIVGEAIPETTAAAMVQYATATQHCLDLLASRPQERTPSLYVIGPECYDTPLAGLDGLSQFILVAKPTGTLAGTLTELVEEIIARRPSSVIYVGAQAHYLAIQQVVKARGLRDTQWGQERLDSSPSADEQLVLLRALLEKFEIPRDLWHPDAIGSDTTLRQYLKDLAVRAGA